jgi:tetratricopeptide (TPR) repeat protein
MKRLWPLLVLVPYLRVLHAPFVYDDKLEVVGNRTIRVLTEVGSITTYNISRPLLIASYAINWWMGQLDPFYYHLTSLAIHLLNTVLAGALGRRLLGDKGVLWALVWALHPMGIEGVTYITGRSDALEATFWFVALIGWWDWLEGKRGRGLAFVGVAGALLSKEVGAALPFALMGLEFCRRGKVAWRAYGGLLGVLGLAVCSRLYFYGWPVPEVDRSWWLQGGIQAEVWVRYLKLWLLPFGQSILHDHPNMLSSWTLPALFFWFGVGAAAVWLWKRGARIQVFLVLLWTLPLLVASSIPLKELMAEHRTYLSGFAFVGLVLSALPELFTWRVGLVVMGVLGVLTGLRNEVWRSEITLWEDAAAKNPESAEAAYGAGDALRFAARYPEAKTYYEKALILKPDYVDALINLGIVLASTGKMEEAEKNWLQALRLNPKACAVHNNLGALALQKGKIAEAVRSYQSAMTWCPTDPVAQLALGDLFFEVGEGEKAMWHYRKYLEVEPGGAGAKRARGRLKVLDR